MENSGVMIPPVEEVTVQKYDSQFGTNVMGACVIVYHLHIQADIPIHECVGHWLFTKLLLPALFAATDASPTREKARVVTVSSSANYLAKEIDFEAIVDGPTRRKNDIWTLYNRSKLVGVHDVILLIFADRLAGVAVCRVTLWQPESWGVNMVTRSCRRVSTQETSTRIFNATCPGGRLLSLYVSVSLLGAGVNEMV